jgi:hypothetical protein
MGYLSKIFAFIPLLWLLGPVPVICAHEVEDNLVRISLNIFPKLVAVDLDMKQKLTPDGKVRFHVFYNKKQEIAGVAADHLAEDYPRIANFATQVTVGKTLPDEVPTAILIVEHLEEGVLNQLIEYGISKHILVFSPYQEDVGRGVTASMYMAIRIHPYFNRDTLERSQIHMHKILIRSAKFYE